MKSITIKKLYKLHSWVGIISGILLFVIAFTGAVAVFARPELKVWANEEISSPIKISPQAYQQVIDKYAQDAGKEFQEEVHFRLPSARNTEYARIIYEGHFEDENGKEQHIGKVYVLDPRNLENLGKFDMDEFFELEWHDMSTFLAHFHADLHLGRPLGLILTGLLGLTLMVSIVTGIFIHRKILAQLFTFRPTKSFSLMLNDGHKVMSVWGVLFHSVIAFTGAFLGLATVILVPAAAYVGFNGDQEKLIETFTAIKAPQIAHIDKPTKLADILQHSLDNNPKLTFNNVTIMGYGDENALVYVQGAGDEQLGGQTLVYQGATGEFIRKQANFGRLEGVTGKILDAMFPLHFGNFGGILVKVIWGVLGLATALLPISGIMLWIERGLNAQHPAHSKQTFVTFQKLLIGTCGGVVLATFALFPAQLLLNEFYSIANQTTPIFTVFFGTWFAATFAALFMKARTSFHMISYIAIWCLLITMPMDIALTGSHVFALAETQHYVSVGVDLSLFAIGLIALMLMKKTKEKATTQTTDVIPEPV